MAGLRCAIALAGLTFLGVAACSDGESPPSTATSSLLGTRSPTAEPDPLTPTLGTASIPAAEDAPTTVRGDVVKELGEYGELVQASGGEPYFAITIRSIRVIDSCPGEFAEPPHEGQFVVADVHAWMADGPPPTVSDSSEILMFTGPDQFRIVDERGVEYAGLGSDAAWTCYEQSERLIYTIAPGEQNEGYIVLDSPVRHGSLIFAPAGDLGWKWKF